MRASRWIALVAALPSTLAAQSATQADSAARAATRTNGLPLINTRTLKFTTDEGTWISLDVSPNGRSIVFELLGDLYTMPISGGPATRITNGPGYDTQPRFSPDGTRLVFLSDRNGSENIWIANADGTQPRALTRTERINFVSPTWTPDGQYIMATRAGQLWLFHLNGGSGVQVTGVRPAGAAAAAGPPGAGAGPTLLGAAFSNDPRYVWVNAVGNVGGDFQGGVSPAPNDEEIEHAPRSSARRIGTYQVALYDRELGRAAVRTSEGEGAFRPIPSPDGKWLVYATRSDAREGLKLLDLETGRDRWLRMDVQRDASQGGADRDVYPNSAFTPDSRAVITAYNGKIWRVEVPSGAATMIPFSAEVEQQVGPLAKFDYPINDTTLVVSQIRGAQPSPDGRRVVFTALDRLWIADLPAARGGPGRAPNAPANHPVITNARRLTNATLVEHAPVWSPDGQFVAYVTWDDSIGGHIQRVRADGASPPQQLTTRAAFYDKVSYAPNGQRLVGVRGSLNHRLRTLEDFGSHGATAELEIVWLPSAGGDAQRIAWLGSGATQQGRNVPHFGPDSTRIYVWQGTEGLVSMRYDGTDRRTVVRVSSLPAPGGPGAAGSPDEVMLAPNGGRALVRSDRNVFLITVPPVGGTPPTVSIGSGSVVPTTRLTRVGGDFIGWSGDGRTAFYSIGKSFFRWDIAFADSLVRDSVVRAEAAAASGGAGAGGAARPDSARADSTRRGPAYEPSRVDVAITVRKDRPSGVVALRGARIITMKGDEVIASGDIVVRDNRIVAIGRRGSVRIPAGARVIDVSGKTIMPGLVDIHAHTWVAWGVHRPQVSQFLAQLAYGVTTQRDPQTSSEDIVTYSDMMETGALIGPRLYSTGPGVFSVDNIRSLDEARDVLRRYADHFNTQTIKQYMAGDRKVRQWVITAAREMGLTTTTEGGSDFVMNLTLMQDGYPGLEHSLPISPLFKDVQQLHAFSGLTYTPTFIVAYGGPAGFSKYLTTWDLNNDRKLQRFTPAEEIDKWKTVTWQRDDQYVHYLHAQQLTKLLAAGGKLGLGSHGELQGLGTHWELWMMAAGGMKAHDALRLATIGGADAIGLSKDLGSLEVGKLADLLVLDRNPLLDLANTTALRFVMKNGRVYDANTLDEIWPRAQPLAPQWWWNLEPPPPGH
ncbi:MAG: PD40 domain-containing protein [Gemmatimonadetes bacterium]|nr:PD40 domain-containing protein [Gemmatimonadota bacterium]